MIFILSLALVPVFVLIVFMYRKDSVHPEPIHMIIKGLIYGVISCFVSLMITSLQESGADDFADAFIGAALPEEFAKLLMLWMLVRKSEYFDEPVDAIVYSVCVTLGFAGFENVMYLMDGGDVLSLGIMRGLFSVPGHFCFGVCMGYFYALAHFGKHWNMVYRFAAYFVPVLLHGLYDGLLSLSDDDTALIVIPIWIVFCIFMYRKALKRIEKTKENVE